MPAADAEAYLDGHGVMHADAVCLALAMGILPGARLTAGAGWWVRLSGARPSS